MFFFILVGVIVVLFVVGVSFILMGYQDTPDVAVKQIKEIEKDLEVKTDSENKLQTDLTSVRKELEETKINLKDAKKLEDEIATLEDKESRYKDDIRKLKVDVGGLSRKADHQAQEAVEVITELKQENETLKSSQTLSQEAQDQVKNLLSEKEELNRQLEENQAKISALENSLAEVKALGNQQAQGAVEVIESLKEEASSSEALRLERESLQEQVQQKESHVQELENQLNQTKEALQQVSSQEQADEQAQATLNTIKEENQSLKQKIEKDSVKIAQLQNDLESAKSQASKPGAPSQQAADGSLNEVYSEFKSQLEEMKETVHDLKSGKEKTGADAGQGKLDHEVQKLKEMNTFLAEKEKKLQAELNKSRVQAMGFKKISEDFKTQLERMSKKS